MGKMLETKFKCLKQNLIAKKVVYHAEAQKREL